MTILSDLGTNAVSALTQGASTANETVHLPDEFLDLAELAREADRVTGNNRAWPLPFTINKGGTDHASTQEYGVKIRFIFTYPGLAEALQQEDATLQVPKPDNLKQRVNNWGRRGKSAPISTESGDKTWFIERWSREAYLRQKIKEGCSPEDVVAEIKSITGYTTAYMLCYRYGPYGGGKDLTEKLEWFAAGLPGFERMCNATRIDQRTVTLQLSADGKQCILWGTYADGRIKKWLIRRLGWTRDQDGKLTPLPDSRYLRVTEVVI